jgi:hypothetical protein
MTLSAVALLCLALLSAPLASFAQPQQRTFRIGMLAAGSPTQFTDAIFTALEGLGYVAGW